MSKTFCCLYCGDLCEMSDAALKILKNKPRCCEYLMYEVDMDKMISLPKSLDILKENVEKEILKGINK